MASVFCYAQDEITCGVPAIKFYNLVDEVYAGEELNFIARVMSYGFVDTLCALDYAIYKEEELIENISDFGSLKFRIRVQGSDYTDVELTEGSGMLGFQYSFAFWVFDVYAATLGIFDGYCPGGSTSDSPTAGRNRPFNFTSVIDEYGMYRINFTISKCSNEGNSIYQSFTSRSDAAGCCDDKTHNDRSSGNCDNPVVIREYDLYLNVVSTKILAQPLGGVICQGEQLEMSVVAETHLENGLTYQWYKDDEIIEGANLATYTTSEAGIYYCMIDDGRELRRTNDAVVNYAEFADMFSTYYLCNGDSASISLPQYESYLWSDETTESVNVFYETGEYTVTVVDSQGCELTKTFLVETALPFELIEDETIVLCGATDTITLDVDLVSNPVWNDTLVNVFSYVLSSADVYTLTANAYGCSYADTVEVIEAEIPESGLLSEYSFEIQNTDTVLFINVNDDYETYLWNNGTSTYTLQIACDTIDFPYSSEYILSVISEYGCILTDTANVEIIYVDPVVVETQDLLQWSVVPNPNNGIFEIVGPDFQKVEIFDSNGRMVCATNTKKLDLTNLQSGIYYLKIYSDNKLERLNFLKLR